MYGFARFLKYWSLITMDLIHGCCDSYALKLFALTGSITFVWFLILFWSHKSMTTWWLHMGLYLIYFCLSLYQFRFESYCNYIFLESCSVLEMSIWSLDLCSFGFVLSLYVFPPRVHWTPPRIFEWAMQALCRVWRSSV